MSKIVRFLREEEAATAVEYAVMLALIIVACVGMVALVGTRTAELWGANDQGLKEAFTGVGS